jgi:hypothetical protein
VAHPSRLGGPEIDSDRAERTRARRLRRTVEDVRLPGDLKIGETSSEDRRLQLCLQQSTGNSAGPEVDLLLRPLGNLPADEDVGDLKSPA